MAYLQSSGEISLSQVQSHWGGSNPISMGEYYRNGSYVPSTVTVTTTTTTTTREPSSGSNLSLTNPQTQWYTFGAAGGITVRWAGSTIVSSYDPWTATSLTSGGWTYYRDTYYSQTYGVISYRVYRQQTTTSSSSTNTNINTGIPTSGTISMNQFYNGRNS